MRTRHPVRRKRAALSIDEATRGLVCARLVVRPEHVVFVKGVLEASEGAAALFAERGGDLTIAATESFASELTRIVRDLAEDLAGATISEPRSAAGA